MQNNISTYYLLLVPAVLVAVHLFRVRLRPSLARPPSLRRHAIHSSAITGKTDAITGRTQ